MSEESKSLLRIIRGLAKEVKNEFVAALLVVVILVVVAISTNVRSLEAIGALVLVVVVFAYVLIKLSAARGGADSILGECAKETSPAVIDFSVDLLGRDTPEDIRRTVVQGLSDYLEWLTERARRKQHQELASWFDAMRKVPKDELDRLGWLNPVLPGGGGSQPERGPDEQG